LNRSAEIEKDFQKEKIRNFSKKEKIRKKILKYQGFAVRFLEVFSFLPKTPSLPLGDEPLIWKRPPPDSSGN
jgi:hypothetical protein